MLIFIKFCLLLIASFVGSFVLIKHGISIMRTPLDFLIIITCYISMGTIIPNLWK